MPFASYRPASPRELEISSAYSQGAASRLCRVAAFSVALLALGTSLSGCSMSYQMGGLFGKDEEKSDRTASVASVRHRGDAKPSEADLARAKQAATDIVSRGSKDGSQPWENPVTGARGTVTPMAATYAQNGTECRDFLASYVQGENETWFQGDACRNGQRWEVRQWRPLRRT
jgi:surface antigen